MVHHGTHSYCGVLALIIELIRPYLRWLYLSVDPSRRPDYFSACWRYPSCRIDDGLAGLVRPAGQRSDFLFFPMNDWHARVQRSHHLARGLAALGSRCFWFNPHLGCEYRRPYLLDPRSRLGVLDESLYEVHVHLPREHVFHQRMLRQSESDMISSAVRKLTSAARVAAAVQIVSFPIWLDVALSARKRFGFPIVYDCHDLLDGFQNTSPDIVASEAALFDAADLVVFSAEWLMRTAIHRYPAVRGRSVLIRNAVDAAHFGAAPPRRARSGASEPVTIGYVGALDHWFDVEAVSAAVEDHPDWSFVIAGRVEDSRVLSLGRHSNVRLMGEVPYSGVPALLSTFDVAVIPFLITDLTRAANPIKLYEYFSLGLPVVSTRLPELEPFGDLVYLADSQAEFSTQLGRAASERSPGLRQRRIETARAESWSSRVDALLEAIDQFCERQACAGR